MGPHLLLSCRSEAQAIKWQGYGEITDLQIPKFELLFRFCVNIYNFKNHYWTENNKILLLSVTVTWYHGECCVKYNCNHTSPCPPDEGLSSQCWSLMKVRDTWTTHRLQWWHASLHTWPRDDGTLALLCSLRPFQGSLLTHGESLPNAVTDEEQD